MFFSTKLLYPILAVASIASSAFALPATATAAVQLATRQADGPVSDLQTFQSTVSPLIDQLTQAAATSQDPSPIVDNISSAFADHSNSFKSKYGKHSPATVDLDVDLFVSVAVDIVVKLVVALSKFSVLDVLVKAKVDAFLSVWIKALAVVYADIGVKIGKGIPGADISLFAVLKLVLSAKVLAIVDVLGLIKL
ncbi:hypothetical protein K474DRAFT_1669215 [Panus rudis PR-1116 ss-1]|nr:hypothetical protein K474DRAFT_1669215 [Panus rudis PR-1116 ss-1]